MASPDLTATIDTEGRTPALGFSRAPAAAVASAARLAVVLECDRPLAGGSSHSLADVDTVVLGRGSRRAALRNRDSRQLRLELPDGWVSTSHARIFRRDGELWIGDTGSTNGTKVNGSDIPARWWELLHSEHLNELIEYGVLHNADLEAAEAAVRVAQANALVTPTGFGGQAATFLSNGELAALANFHFAPVATIIGANSP